jgi:hypothetical protein
MRGVKAIRSWSAEDTETAGGSGILDRTMHKVFLRLGTMGALLSLPLAASIWAGCSSDEGGTTDAPDSAIPDSSVPDTYDPPKEAGIDASPPKRDCAADVQADGLQQHLDCTGLYADFGAKTVAPENKLYTPGVTFWSDGAEKARYLYLPPGAKIDIANFDEWKFPNGTKVWKEFKLAGKRIETRLYLKTKDSWRHTTYRWNDAETDAVRKDSGERVMQAGKPDYEVPNTGQCDACHAGKTEPLLGIEAVSLGLPTAQGVTLASLAADGRFSVAPPVTTITIPDDTATKVAAPALGWLHANCGACHNDSPNAGAAFTKQFFMLRPSQLLPEAGTATVQDLDTWKTAVNVPSSRQDVDAGTNYLRIAGGDPAHSLASILSGRRVTGADEPNPIIQMPPLVTRQVDTQGHALLDAWINALPPPP